MPLAEKIVKLNSLAELDFLPAPLLSSDNLGWRGIRLERHYVSTDVPRRKKFYADHVVGIALGGEVKNEYGFAGAERVVSYRKGDAIFCPAGFAYASFEPREMDLLLIYIEPEFIKTVSRDILPGGEFEFVPQLRLEDSSIKSLSELLLNEAQTGGETGAVYAESLTTALALKLIKNYSIAQRIPPPVHQGGLAKHKLRKAIDFINEHLIETPSLQTLAALCDLSPSHFARAFKQSTAYAPHQFVNLRRIERGKEFLKNSELSVTEIAYRLGFSDQSHFTRVFRRMVGLSPYIFRVQVK